MLLTAIYIQHSIIICTGNNFLAIKRPLKCVSNVLFTCLYVFFVLVCTPCLVLRWRRSWLLWRKRTMQFSHE